LKATHELQFLVPIFERDGYFGLYKYVMEMEQAQVNQVLQPLLDRILPLYQHQQLTKDKEDFWAARAALTYNQSTNIDRGIFSVYIFNLLHLHPGEAIFQDAGLPHAYLEGQNVEIMANSDNVLRGGLTPKHIDVHELLKHVVFEETVPNIIQAKQVREYMQVYQTPAPDFELAKLSLKKNQSVSIVSRSTEIFIVMQGSVEIMERQYRMLCKAGDSFVSFHAAGFDVQANDDTVIYSASVAFPHA